MPTIKVIKTYEDGPKISEIAVCDHNDFEWLDLFIGFLGALVALYFMVM